MLYLHFGTVICVFLFAGIRVSSSGYNACLKSQENISSRIKCNDMNSGQTKAMGDKTTSDYIIYIQNKFVHFPVSDITHKDVPGVVIRIEKKI